MIPRVRYRALLFLASLTMLAVPGRPHTDADHIKGEYISITAQLQKHLVFDWWIDSDPKPPELLARQWSLAGQYVAAWLDTHPSQGTAGVKEALTQLEPGESAPQQKKFFRSFFCCGTCGERPTDWTVRLTPTGVQDLGEKSVVPELDIVDEHFYRVIHHESFTEFVDSRVIKSAEGIVAEARAEESAKDWTKFPSLGMMGTGKTKVDGDTPVLCLSLDEAGPNLFTLQPIHGKFYITDLKGTKQSCEDWWAAAVQ